MRQNDIPSSTYTHSFPHCQLHLPRPPLFIPAGQYGQALVLADLKLRYGHLNTTNTTYGHRLAKTTAIAACIVKRPNRPAARGHCRVPGLGLTAIACGPVAWANSHCLRVPPLALTQPGPAALTQPAPATGNRLRGSRRLISYHSFFEARLSSQISPLSK